MTRHPHPVPVDQLWAAYVELGTLERVAQRYGYTKQNVRDRLVRAGHPMQPRWRTRDKIALDVDQLWVDYQRLGTCSAVARLHGVKREIVERRLNRAGYQLHKGPRRAFTTTPAQLWADYKRLGSLGRVAQLYGVSWSIVRRRLQAAGYTINHRGRRARTVERST